MMPMHPCRLILVLLLGATASAQTTQPASAPATQHTIASTRAMRYAASQPTLNLSHHDPLSQRLEAIVLREAQREIAQLKAPKTDSDALIDSAAALDATPLATAQAACGLAELSRCQINSTELTPAILRQKTIALLRSCLAQSTGDDSAACAFYAGKAAWLCWNDLSPKLQRDVGELVSRAADRAMTETASSPDAFSPRLCALAFNMFPHHPHHDQWRTAAIRLQLQSRATPSDVKQARPIDGKPLNQWIKTPALSDDFTLRADGRLRPDLMAEICTSGGDRLLYDWADNPPPQSLSFNVHEIYANLKLLALPDGRLLSPADASADRLKLHVIMSALFNDPQAATLARLALDATEHQSNRGNQPSDPTLAARLCRHADAYLLLRQIGPGPAPIAPAELWRQLAGNHLLAIDKFEVLRTEHSLATFSWDKPISGALLPLDKDQLIAPDEHNLTGRVWTKSATGEVQDTPVLKSFRRISPIDPATAVPGVPPLPKDVFAIAGVLTRAGGLLEQPFAFVALPDGRAVYLDNPRLTSDAKPARCRFGTLAILNDPRLPWNDGLRSIFFENGVMTFAAHEAAHNAVAHFSSNWFCIDGLGIIVLSSSGQQRYRPHPLDAAGPLQQLLVLSHVSRMPDDLRPTALVFYPGYDWSRTRDAASHCTLQQPDAHHFVITLDDGKAITVDFTRNVISMTP